MRMTDEEWKKQRIDEWRKVLLGDPDPKKPSEAASTLGEGYGDYEGLSQVLATEHDSGVRKYIALGLGHTKNINAFTPLRSLLNDSSVTVRGNTIHAIEELTTYALQDSLPINHPVRRDFRLQVIETLSHVVQRELNPNICKLAESLRLYLLSITK